VRGESGRARRAGLMLAAGAERQTWLGRRLPTGLVAAASVCLSVAAFAARTAPPMVGLSAVELVMALTLCPQRRRLARDGARVLAWQTAVIVGLYALRYGATEWHEGARISWQLFLAFLPGMVLLRSTPAPRLVQALNRVMPYRAAFVLTTSLRFVPLVLREVRAIHEVQLLRGARVLPRDLARPWNWPDLVNCVLVPAIIQSLALAGEISLAARARGFGCGERRTYWPGS